jgi:hypothetical protein
MAWVHYEKRALLWPAWLKHVALHDESVKNKISDVENKQKMTQFKHSIQYEITATATNILYTKFPGILQSRQFHIFNKIILLYTLRTYVRKLFISTAHF